MYERFTERAKRVMQFANQEAQRLNHEHFGTEHILLGLLKEGTGCGARVLEKLGIALPDVRLEVEKLVQRGPDMVRLGKLPQTPRAQKVINYAMEEARALHHNYVGTEHILLGILRETDCTAVSVLTGVFGLTLAKVREEVAQPTAPEERLVALNDQALQLQAGQVFLDFLSDAGASADEVVTLLQILRRPQPPSDATDELVVLYLYVVRGQVMLPFERLIAGLKGHNPSRKAVPIS